MTARPLRPLQLLLEDPPGPMVHESATVSNVWPMSPCYSNLVYFHPVKPLDIPETVIPELAEKWSPSTSCARPRTLRRGSG